MNIALISMVYINECIDVKTPLKKFLQMYKFCIGSNSFQEISYAGKSQVLSSYILSNP